MRTSVCAYPRRLTDAPTIAVREEPANRQADILLVEDEAAIRRLMVTALEPNHVRAVESVTDALAELEARSFDVVICDIMLLDGTGIDVYEWVCANRSELVDRFVFITGGAFTPRAEAFFAETTVPVLPKPFLRREVLRAINQLLPHGEP